MKNRTTLLLASLCLLMISCASGKSEEPMQPENPEKKVSVLGDSYSTFFGHVTPKNNSCYYGTEAGEATDVRQVEQMWWHLLIDQLGYKLECNNSYSGATICNTGYNAADFTDISFITRMSDLGNPDIILILGGTNDDWAQAPLGEMKYQDWTREDLYKFRPAFSYLLNTLLKRYPNAKIYNITNSELSYQITQSIDQICTHYKVPNIQLKDIDKQAAHPTIRGMQSICVQLKSAMTAK